MKVPRINHSDGEGTHMHLNLVLHPAEPSVRHSFRLGIKILALLVAVLVFGVVLSALGFHYLSFRSNPRPLVVFIGMALAFVPIPYALEFLRNRSWSKIFGSTTGKVEVHERTLTLELELSSHGASIDQGSASAEVLLRWRTGVLRRATLFAALEEITAVARSPEDDGTRWRLTGAATWTDPIPEALGSVRVECEVGVTLKVEGNTRTRILQGRSEANETDPNRSDRS